jgi:hypothetical protein|tara:strand:- start:81 stop:269 length:189 start_codon:yes stop_codon:yes gene_type:complete
MKFCKNADYRWLKNKDILFCKTSRTILKESINIIFEQNTAIYGNSRIKKNLREKAEVTLVFA